MGAQSMVIAGVSDGTTQEILVLINALNKRSKKNKKLCVLAGGLARLKEISAVISTQRPVIMLT